MNASRRATFAVATMLGGLLQVAATTSCGTESHDSSDGSAGAFETGSQLTDARGDSTVPAGDDGGTGLPIGDSSPSDGPDACAPSLACPAGVQCGRYVDPCTGNVFACGAPCPSGQICVSTGSFDSPAQSCQPKNCAGQCGTIGVDSCGVAVGCGGCPAGQACVANQCAPQSSVADAGVSDGCAPLTCTPSPQLHACGTVHDGCGNSMQCSCPAGQQCVSGACSPPAPECSAGGSAKCGSIKNACGSGQVACGGCQGANKCTAGMCTPCTPASCGTSTCGQVSNGCGPEVSCGTCPTSEVCDDGGCCTPMTCAAALDAGIATGCAPVYLGCSVTKSCRPCAAGQVCANNTCMACTPKTCADFGNAGCGHSDGCGSTLNCCGAGLSCQGGLCCPPGQVNYNGSCCLPACNPDGPSGTQVSCGQVLICP